MFDNEVQEDSLAAILSFEVFSENVKTSINELDAIIQDYNKVNKISNEVLTDNTSVVWTRTEANRNKTINNVKKYHEVINSGINRLAEELTMLGKVADQITTKKPYKLDLTIRNPNRFTINGKFEPTNVRPLLSEFQNLLNFNEKILGRFGDVTFDLLTAVEFDEKFLEKFNGDLTAFKAKNWLRSLEPVDTKNDTRFKETQTVYKGQTFNSNRAIYYVGPADDMPSGFESNRHKWTLTQKTLANLRFKCLNDRNVRLLTEKNLTFKTSNLMSIKQRCNILSGMLKRLVAKRRDINKFLDNIDRIFVACLDIKTKAEKVKAIDDSQTEARPFPSENKVFLESLILYRNALRLTFDYFNITSIFLRILGAQAYLCNLELKAYSEPLANPENKQEQRK